VHWGENTGLAAASLQPGKKKKKNLRMPQGAPPKFAQNGQGSLIGASRNNIKIIIGLSFLAGRGNPLPASANSVQVIAKVQKSNAMRDVKTHLV
jgi:hypothetical protein